MFGGLHDTRFLSKIERFDDLLGDWITLDVQLPMPLCKLGAVSMAPFGMFKSVLVLGGLNEDQDRMNSVLIFDAEAGGFDNFPPMKRARSFNPGSGVAIMDGSIITVVAGSPSGDGGEYFSITHQAKLKQQGETPQWVLLPSHLTDYERQLEL